MTNSFRIIAVSLCVVGLSASVYAQKKPKKELYVPMDYSTCGYRASEQAIPDVPVKTYVEWQSGDCSAIIQQAIDHVSRMKPDAWGRRGAVLLGEGVFCIDEPLRITASGVVLRGVNRDGTVIEKRGVDRGAALYIEGRVAVKSGCDTLFVDGKVQAGSTVLSLNTPLGDVRRRFACEEHSILCKQSVTLSGCRAPKQSSPTRSLSLKPHDRVFFTRPCTKQWILSLGMDDFGGGLDYTGWKPTDIDVVWDRTVTAVNGNTITLDAPITTTISPDFGAAYILKANHDGELTECGVENLTIQSEVNNWNPKDEDHCWDGIYVDNTRDSWVRRVNFRRLAGSAVNLQLHTSRFTVEDCIARDPVSEVGGWRRQVFLTRGQQTLFQRCVSRQGIHDFAAGFCAAGPNAFVQCEGEESLGFSGSIGSWAAGLLFDIVNIDGNDLRFANLEQFQFGTGWNTANSMFWQCTASTIECYSPDADNRSSAHGCWGTLTGNGEWTSSNDHVSPRSLFYDQLKKRLSSLPSPSSSLSSPSSSLPSPSPVVDGSPVNAYILPRPTNATSSPSADEALAMAKESLTQPRLTMEMWIDSIPFTADVNASGVKAFRSVDKRQQAPALIPTVAPARTLVAFKERTRSLLPVSLTASTGNQYNIPWWSGRVKDNFVAKDAKPAITRFVPGREGTGWTDRIDSVVSYLADHHYSSLSHHYGLWYDLRRTDHERVRRADGDVWAPFYEQPFARSGQGIAWDGLSRYDLTKPNRWYWSRLNEFAGKAAEKGILLFHHHYFQHNILEAGAHWVDCPWRPVNNINYTPFPEPVPFAGDKRIFMAEQFYDEQNPVLRPLHRQYIRMCLDELKDQPNVVHLISAEYTGPLHFTRFWLQTIAEWEQETGCHPLVALSCTKDAQDSLLDDPVLNKVIDIIDIRYWHYNSDGLWAPEAGKNMAPRQWMRKMKVGKTGFNEAYRAVREYRERYPDKAVTFFAQQYPNYGWAILMAGGSLANVPIKNVGLGATLLSAVSRMYPLDGTGCVALGSDAGYLVYPQEKSVSVPVVTGRYNVYAVDSRTGEVTLKQKKALLTESFSQDVSLDKVYWLEPK